MHEPRQFLWLCKMGIEFVFAPPVLIASVVVAAGCIFIFAKQRPDRTQQWHPTHWLILTQLLFFPAVIAVAVLGGVNYRPPVQVNRAAYAYESILWWSSFVLAAFWVWHFKGLRLIALSLVALQQLVLCGAFLTAEMATSGRWL